MGGEGTHTLRTGQPGGGRTAGLSAQLPMAAPDSTQRTNTWEAHPSGGQSGSAVAPPPWATHAPGQNHGHTELFCRHMLNGRAGAAETVGHGQARHLTSSQSRAQGKSTGGCLSALSGQLGGRQSACVSSGSPRRSCPAHLAHRCTPRSFVECVNDCMDGQVPSSMNRLAALGGRTRGHTTWLSESQGDSVAQLCLPRPPPGSLICRPDPHGSQSSARTPI